METSFVLVSQTYPCWCYSWPCHLCEDIRKASPPPLCFSLLMVSFHLRDYYKWDLLASIHWLVEDPETNLCSRKLPELYISVLCVIDWFISGLVILTSEEVWEGTVLPRGRSQRSWEGWLATRCQCCCTGGRFQPLLFGSRKCSLSPSYNQLLGEPEQNISI